MAPAVPPTQTQWIALALEVIKILQADPTTLAMLLAFVALGVVGLALWVIIRALGKRSS